MRCTCSALKTVLAGVLATAPPVTSNQGASFGCGRQLTETLLANSGSPYVSGKRLLHAPSSTAMAGAEPTDVDGLVAAWRDLGWTVEQDGSSLDVVTR